MSRGLALYQSLKANTSNFHLYILAFSHEAFQALSKLELKHATIISMSDFENKDLLSVKDNRTLGEYCWTCTSSLINYCLDYFNLDHCIYLDADLYFFNDPNILLSEIQSESVLITEHRYTPRYDQSALSGKYCVQFMYFKNDERGRKCLNWWLDACIDWCYNKHEDGKFGDQKYLDDWEERFTGVHVLNHLGGGVAPWNVQQYQIKENESNLEVHSLGKDRTDKLVFYHFHELAFYDGNKIDLGGYSLSKSTIQKVYIPYVEELLKMGKQAEEVGVKNPHGIKFSPKTAKESLRNFKRTLRGTNNVYNLKSLLN